jgi:hypothetical protein
MSPFLCVELKGADGQADVFDGAMVALAMFTMLTRFHPGVLLYGPDKLESDVDYMKVQDFPIP